MIKNIRAAIVDAARKGVFELVSDGVPGATFGVGMAGKGSTATDRLTGKQYTNTGDATTPAWTVTGTQT